MDLENFICIFETKLVNVAMRTAEAFYNIFMYLYNKNILEYGQIARNGTESMVPDTEGCSIGYPFLRSLCVFEGLENRQNR